MRKVNGHIRLAMLCVSLVLAFAVSSCSIFAPAKTPEELLAGSTSKTWVMTKLLDNDGKDITSAFVKVTLTFKKDNSYSTVQQLATSGSPAPAQTSNGTWKLSDKQLSLTGDSGTSIQVISDLTETSLIFAPANSPKSIFTLKAQ